MVAEKNGENLLGSTFLPHPVCVGFIMSSLESRCLFFRGFLPIALKILTQFFIGYI